MRFLLKDVRLAFPSIFKQSAPKAGGELAFSASFLIPKAHPQLPELRAALLAVAKEKWGVKADAIYKALVAGDKTCLHNGDAKSDYEGFADHFFVSARSKTRPTVYNEVREPVEEADGKIYSGCYVNVSLELWPQDNSFGKRVNAQLRGVQFLRKGDAFAGGATPANPDEFEEISVEDGAAEDPLTQ